jgi:hypothetical protein
MFGVGASHGFPCQFTITSGYSAPGGGEDINCGYIAPSFGSITSPSLIEGAQITTFKNVRYGTDWFFDVRIGSGFIIPDGSKLLVQRISTGDIWTLNRNSNSAWDLELSPNSLVIPTSGDSTWEVKVI